MEKRERRRRNFYKREIGKTIECILVRSIFLFLFLLIAVQSVYFFLPQMRVSLNSAINLEGKQINAEELVASAGDIASLPWAVINLKLLDYISLPDVKVLLDGEEVAGFIHNEVALNVKQGSIISVRNYNPQIPVTVIVSKRTPNIEQPAADAGVTGSGTLFFEPVVIK